MFDAMELSELPLLDPDGDQIEAGSLWRDRPVVLALVRHFG
jgi:hypothetical protein